MSTSSIILGSSSIPQQTQTAAAPTKSFYTRCVEDLSPRKVTCFNLQSALWGVVAGVTFVAFLALSVGGFVAATTFMPIYAPFVAISALILATPVASFVKHLLEISKFAGNEARNFKAMQLDAEKIAKQSPIQIQAELSKRGINWFQIPGLNPSAPETFEALSPVLAHIHRIEGTIEAELKTRDEQVAEAAKLAKDSFGKHRLMIDKHRKEALEAEDRALHAKVQSAFAHAALTKPALASSLEDIASFTGITYHERMLGSAAGNASEVDVFLKFKDNKLTPITYNDVKTMQVAELGKRLSAAMAA